MVHTASYGYSYFTTALKRCQYYTPTIPTYPLYETNKPEKKLFSTIFTQESHRARLTVV